MTNDLFKRKNRIHSHMKRVVICRIDASLINIKFRTRHWKIFDRRNTRFDNHDIRRTFDMLLFLFSLRHWLSTFSKQILFRNRNDRTWNYWFDVHKMCRRLTRMSFWIVWIFIESHVSYTFFRDRCACAYIQIHSEVEIRLIRSFIFCENEWSVIE
jgi:hypothetical protein